VALGCANGIGPTFADAWIRADVVDASLVVWALGVCLTFAADARVKRISSVARWTRADWSLALGAIVAWSANGIRSTWIWSAQVFLGEWTTADEGISSVSLWARADWRQSTQVAVGIGSTSSITRILADSIEASGS